MIIWEGGSEARERAREFGLGTTDERPRDDTVLV
jgi:hypothetical protein